MHLKQAVLCGTKDSPIIMEPQRQTLWEIMHYESME
jgi:hypothetical protein